jgi:hypothetical protein
MKKIFFLAPFWVALAFALVLPTSLFSQADFYQGKTIRIIHGRDPGGSGDLRVKAMTTFL